MPNPIPEKYYGKYRIYPLKPYYEDDILREGYMVKKLMHWFTIPWWKTVTVANSEEEAKSYIKSLIRADQETEQANRKYYDYP